MAKVENVITKDQLALVREIDFVNQFNHTSLSKLVEALGVTRKVPLQEGTTIYTYSVDGTLQSGEVAEGDVIPLSQYKTIKTPVGEMKLNKWRKGTTAEAIAKGGYNQSVVDTDTKMLRDIQKTIRANFFGFLNGEISDSVTATGTGLQSALADAWGKLQVAFEDDTAEAVYFLNPEDVATYLGSAQVTMQTAFGMGYIQNFLGLGSVLTNSSVSKGTFIATAKENIIMYYMAMTGDVANAFNLTTDETGYIGIKSGVQNEERAQVESIAMSGVTFGVEYSAGVVKGTITGDA